VLNPAQFAKFFLELFSSRGADFVEKKSQKALGDTSLIEKEISPPTFS
jgi:hypothetical protein